MESALRQKRRLPEKLAWVALVMAFVAGGVDAIGYLLLAHVFTSHMSGNSVKLAVALAGGDWGRSARYAAPIAAFVSGTIAGLLAIEFLAARRVARVFSGVALVELALLTAFFALARPPHEWMLAFPAGAMGVQNALLRRVGSRGIRTTVVTGMIAHFAHALVTRSRSAMALYGLIWTCFVGGGVAGVFLDYRYGPVALLLPVAGLVVLICLDCVRPLTRRVSG